jgi:two-component system, OmpR family, phosphate regulon sensor histidine kinase PhoR
MKPNSGPIRFLGITMAVIFTAEGAIMLFFHILEQAGVVLTPKTEGILDAFLLTVTVFPALYLLLFHPLILEMNRRKQIEQSKNDLLAVIPHELNTPLTIIKDGLSQIIDGSLGPITSKQDVCLKIASANVSRLNKIFEKVSLITQLLKNQVKYRFQPLEIGELINSLEAQLRPISEQKGVALKANCQKQLPVCTADGGRLAEAFGEVLENAIAVTPKGGKVLLSCSAVSNGVELSVQDGGPGIPAQQIPAFFDLLHSIGDIYERKTGGLGLGLYIAKAHIKAHGGTIRLSNKPGRCTCIVMKIPIQPHLQPGSTSKESYIKSQTHT